MVQIRQMQMDDMEAVMEIENENFVHPWTETGLFTFLIREDTLFLVAEEENHVLGYCGIVSVMDEGDVVKVHIDVSSAENFLNKFFNEEFSQIVICIDKVSDLLEERVLICNVK